MDEFRGIVEDPAFKQYFPVVGENFLKTAPKGFSKDYPYLKYLNVKNIQFPVISLTVSF